MKLEEVEKLMLVAAVVLMVMMITLVLFPPKKNKIQPQVKPYSTSEIYLIGPKRNDIDETQRKIK